MTYDPIRYKYDPVIAEAITQVLYEYIELSSNQLRKGVRKLLFDYKEGMRRHRQAKDRNKGYRPSESNISSTLQFLEKQKWVDRKPEKEKLQGLSKVFYSLSKGARFEYDRGIGPEESYQLRDIYQMILRTSATGIYQTVWDKQMKKDRLTRIQGTTIEDIYLKKDELLFANFNHQLWMRFEIEAIFEQAIQEGIIRIDITSKDERYVIDPRLKEFVHQCWWKLFWHTRFILSRTIMLKKFSKDDPDFKNFNDWLLSLYHKKQVDKFIREWAMERNKYANKENKLKLCKDIKELLDANFELRKEMISIYEKNIDKESDLKFWKAKESVLFYTCPDYVIDSIKNVIASISPKRS